MSTDAEPEPPRRHCRRRKHCYPTFEAAAAVAIAVDRRDRQRGLVKPGRLRAYHCAICDAFHFGHEPITQTETEEPSHDEPQ